MMSVRPADEGDREFVQATLNNPSIYDAMVDDMTKGFPLEADKAMRELIFMIPEQDGERVGFFMFHPWNAVCYEVHSAILPPYRGKTAIEAARATIKYMFTHTPCCKIITHVPDCNRKAYALVMRLGWAKEGINHKSLMINGVLHDQYIFGCNKEDYPWEA